MDLSINRNTTHVWLSVRNLRHLLAQVEAGESMPALHRTTPEFGTLSVVVEQDDKHYADRQPGPGYRG